MKKTLLLYCLTLSFSLISQTKVVKTDTGYTFIRNGQPYYVKGLGGEVNFDKMVEIGANSLRTWGVENAQAILDEAHKRGLTVMLGMWLQHERHGFDYDNKEKVKAQLEYFKTVVDRYKNHPAILLWGIGNELDLNYSNTNVWYAVQDIAKYIHETDPMHPTSTVTAGLDSMEVQLISARCPDIDVYCVNTYGDIGNVPSKIGKYGWNGPYMITEWGPNGHWESPQTNWGVSIEQSSTEKSQSYAERFTKYIKPNSSHCIGSYAFLWGAKQEYTETWYGLFSKDNLPTEPIDALQLAFTGKAPVHPAPSIRQCLVDGKNAFQSASITAGDFYQASVNVMLPDSLSNSTVAYLWRVMEESTDKKSGGDVEEAATEVGGLIKGKSNKPVISFRAPDREGYYRLFVTVMHNNKVAYANVPFKVTPRLPGDKPSRMIQLKTVDMSSFDN
ncbi:MAG: glycoside hydrolase family 2 TIM barrel-domain containing protein [Chitinophagaceae bacterium]